MSEAEWQTLAEQQLAAYYKPVRTWEDRSQPVEAGSGIAPEETAATTAAQTTVALFQKKRKRLPTAPKYDDF